MSAVRRVGALAGSVVLALGVAFASQAAAQASDATSLPCPQTTTATASTANPSTATASGSATAGCTPLSLVRFGTNGSLTVRDGTLDDCIPIDGQVCPPTDPEPPCDPRAVDCGVILPPPPVDNPPPPVDNPPPPVDNPPPPVDNPPPPVEDPPPPVTTAPTGGVGRDNAGVDAGLGTSCSGLLCADASYRDRIAAEQPARAARVVQQRAAAAAAAIPGVAQLARTGSELTSTATLAGGLLLVGGTLLLVRRRFAAGYDRRH